MKYRKQPNLPWVNHFYYLVFPNLKQVCSVEDKSRQEVGVDKILRFKRASSITVDEKLRNAAYDDILLEEYSNWSLKTPGWLMKGSLADYISYVIRPQKRIYLLDYRKLKSAWDKNYTTWLGKYGRKFGHTEDYYGRVLYQTSNIPVPFGELDIEYSNDPRLESYLPDRGK